MPGSPEEIARQRIDRMLSQCGWQVQDYSQMNISAGAGVAIREFPLQTGFADYLLYAEGRAIGVVEAKPENYTLTGVEAQSAKYTSGFPESFPRWRLPLPFAYESTGILTRFTNNLDPSPCSREVFTFHRPAELIRLAQVDCQVRQALQHLPSLDAGRLWPVQSQAIQNLEESLAANRPRALVQMATGSGKTFTACNLVYRLIKFAHARRVLFLVDRNNLGRQTLTEFQRFANPGSPYKFTEEFNVQRLRSNVIDPSCKVCITTIQRLYSILKGEPEFDESAEEISQYESANTLFRQPLPVIYNPNIPIETFDFIIIDECHRSIYNLWRQVLEYFDAFLIGLTATPTKQTIGFFNNNLVQEYTHEKAVADGVNVGFEIFRIETQVTRNGAVLSKNPDYFVPLRDRGTRQKRFAALDNDLIYTGNQLDRDVVNENQIRLVLSTFRDCLPRIFPGRLDAPKTLIFAKNDNHAEDITRITRDVFGKGNDFCQKITSKTTGRKPEDLLAEFRNSYNPRIAVTVDMIATGTDVKPLECLLFMRNINSAGYFEQMKGRGCRVISSDDLKGVTPDARAKTHFVIVDAVGVTETDKTFSQPLDRKPSVAFHKILNTVAAGVANADVASTLAARLIRLDRQLDAGQRAAIAAEADGKSPADLAAQLLNSIDSDKTASQAIEQFHLPPDAEPTEEQIDAVEQQALAAALKPFHNPGLREAILQSRDRNDQVIDEINQDVLLQAGFNAAALEKAGTMVSSFKKFIEDNKDEIEAIRVLYSRPYRLGLRYRQVRELAQKLTASPFFVDPKKPESVEPLWRAYRAVEPQKVHGTGRHLVDLIALVKHAITPDSPLVPIADVVEQRYRAWLTEKQAGGTEFSPEQARWLDAIKDHIANALSIEQDDLHEIPFNQLGGVGRAYELFGDKLPALLDELNGRLVA
ncbi:MAG: DEAD/DEAH box helicase family protein [Planctomycetia bacterium]|nr:DEAD/DEAH box helicase family protein [Planctomycetia bacterium]